ncbi:LysM peptidoglycan-binding domain-containing protein [Lentilactobacillus sp. SPB1-3]|uniref:LysM peptidoglycan-binding domain-containing protein n=1 Tax=Lentilactobacillus terminaliae TaxID=3003483 RepID=A0ACD5DDK3_9LACO|nr:LysM peptidoglycan-binding domain-containing protein [Lentilactobacillus sp. SPB1-3]MCZ0978037.1 LysM peptidoglycan-binding domain-containing protein [Lentilactobacillus sp. SPB1-3]
MATKNKHNEVKRTDTNRYEVKPTDNEYTVAQKFGLSVGALRKANVKFPAPYFKVGRKIFIPR